MKKKFLTKIDLQKLVEFNKLRTRIGEPKMSPEEYLSYIYGRTSKPKPSTRKLKTFDIPVWATDCRTYASLTSDHIATKKNDEYKKEVSKNYTVAIAYNKGGYQVLRNEEIATAGRKV